MKKVGIITFYNGNINYGGILQAYALQKVINNLGYECKQICLDNATYPRLTLVDKIRMVIKHNFRLYGLLKDKKKKKNIRKELKEIKNKQQNGFKQFEESIPHTKNYKFNELRELDSQFDIFVCGSDQIWTPNSGGIRPVPHKHTYYLNFTEKKKISYAASFGADNISKEHEVEITPLINKLDYISVREENAKKILGNKIDKEIEVVCDPVLLLDKEEWDKIKKEPKENNYIFAYILGSNKKSREIAENIAETKDKKLITVPFIGEYCKKDYSFGDIIKIGISPNEFLGYIKKADLIITDSFHCAVFSIIFNKQFIVLKRTSDNNKSSMNSRLYDLLSKLDLQEHVVSSLNECNQLFDTKIDYSIINPKLNKEKGKSIKWLKDSLESEI